MPTRPVLQWCLPILLAFGGALTGCGSLGKPAPTPPVPPAGGVAPPRWAPTQELVTGKAAAPAPDRAGPVFDLGDPEALRAQVRERCAAISLRTEPAGALADLAGALLADGVEAGRALDALYRARCGALGAVVRALVSQGGPPVVASVVDRALFLGGPAAEPMVTAAVSAGLQRDLRSWAPAPSRAAGLRHAMAYFPVAASQPAIVEADDLVTLYDSARPGYALYTFILAGATEDPQALETWRELLRVIETYVLVASLGPELPLAQTHAFLIPLRPERSGAELLAQTEPALAAPLREALAAQLRAAGRAELAERLTSAPGPFLITTLDPALVGGDAQASRLLVDLSGTGPETAYAIIDAFDQPIPPELVGQPDRLRPLVQRLTDLPAGPGGGAQLALHLLGRR